NGAATERATSLAEPPRVLLVLADEALVNTFHLVFRHGGYSLRTERSLKDARTALAEWRPHLLLLDMEIESGALGLIAEVHAAGRTRIIALAPQHDTPPE